MTGLLTLAIGAALCALTILPYFVRYRARERTARARLAHTQSTTPRGAVEIPNEYVFIFAGGEPPHDLLRKVGIRFHSQEM